MAKAKAFSDCMLSARLNRLRKKSGSACFEGAHLQVCRHKPLILVIANRLQPVRDLLLGLFPQPVNPCPSALPQIFLPSKFSRPPNEICTKMSSRSSYLPKFEECLERLEKIVAELEKGDISLDHALELFDEGMKLSGSCRKELEEAEGKVEILLKRNGKLQPEAFESVTQPDASK